MNPSYIIPIILVLLILFLQRRNEGQVAARRIQKKKSEKERAEMVELARRFIEKECLIYTFNGGQLEGTVKEVTDGAILIDKGGNLEAVNIDYVMRLREYPKNKNGKKKSVVLD